jgi:hypothetical protein
LGYQAYTDKPNQMVFGNASVTEFKFDRNASAVLNAPQISATSASASVLERTSTGTNTAIDPLLIRHTTSDDMVDGFGVLQEFAIQDSANVSNTIAELGALRSGADNSGRLVFRTATTGTTNERMTILPDGKVGIGTASPASLLSVVTSSNADGIQVRRNSVTTNDYAMLGFRIANTDATNAFAEIRAVRTNRVVSADTDLSFFTRSNAIVAERLRIRDDGLVGINETFAGDTPPNGQLVVKSGATTRISLIVDSLTSHATSLQEWRVNGSRVSSINQTGRLLTPAVTNANTGNNSSLLLNDLGAVISRNQSTSDPALIVNQIHASSTGHIQVWQSETLAKAHITRTGIFVGQSRPTRTDITANATLALADEGKVLRVNPVTAADNITITVPPNGDVAFPVDTEIAIVRYNSGTVTIVAGSGVTIQSKDGNDEISGRYGSVALKKIGEDEWVLVGSLE